MPSTTEGLASVDTEPGTSSSDAPAAHQDADLEIDGATEMETIDPGTAESVDLEEEEDINGDVIRCLCNEVEEGGFMIQVQCKHAAITEQPNINPFIKIYYQPQGR